MLMSISSKRLENDLNFNNIQVSFLNKDYYERYIPRGNDKNLKISEFFDDISVVIRKTLKPFINHDDYLTVCIDLCVNTCVQKNNPSGYSRMFSDYNICLNLFGANTKTDLYTAINCAIQCYLTDLERKTSR